MRLSLHSFHQALKLVRADIPFYALIAAGMMKADTDNLQRLKAAFPGFFEELQRRYNAELGVLPEDGPVDMGLLRQQIERI
jgi:hypothetical protein